MSLDGMDENNLFIKIAPVQGLNRRKNTVEPQQSLKSASLATVVIYSVIFRSSTQSYETTAGLENSEAASQQPSLG